MPVVLHELPAWRQSKKRKPIASSKYCFFDVGILAALQGREFRRSTLTPLNSERDRSGFSQDRSQRSARLTSIATTRGRLPGRRPAVSTIKSTLNRRERRQFKKLLALRGTHTNCE